MSDSLWPHGLKPTSLLPPWDSPGKNTGVGCHFLLQCIKVKSESEVAQSCLTLSDPMDCSLPVSSLHGILQARTLEWVAISFSNAWKWKVKVKLLSPIWLLVNPWTAAYQAPPSMGFSRQEYWSGLPLPSPHKAWDAADFFFLIKEKTIKFVWIQDLSKEQSSNWSDLSWCFTISSVPKAFSHQLPIPFHTNQKLKCV